MSSNMRSSVSELSSALRSCRAAFWGIGAMSGMLNVLALTGSLFMLQVYDRVIPSRSVSTLIGLSIIVGVLYVFQGALDALRMRVLSWSSSLLDERVGRRVFDAAGQVSLRIRPTGDGLQPQRDLDQVRGYLSSTGPTAFFDLPWIPLYLGICFLFHFWIGVLATAGALILCALTLMTELLTVGPPRKLLLPGSNGTCLPSPLAATRRSCKPWGSRGSSADIGRRPTRATLRASGVSGMSLLAWVPHPRLRA